MSYTLLPTKSQTLKFEGYIPDAVMNRYKKYYRDSDIIHNWINSKAEKVGKVNIIKTIDSNWVDEEIYSLTVSFIEKNKDKVIKLMSRNGLEIVD